MRPGIYARQIAADNWTEDQRAARGHWARARAYEAAIFNALESGEDGAMVQRERLHRRLDRMLDIIDQHKARAQQLFPDVEDSYTIASTRMRL